MRVCVCDTSQSALHQTCGNKIYNSQTGYDASQQAGNIQNSCYLTKVDNTAILNSRTQSSSRLEYASEEDVDADNITRQTNTH